MSLNRWELLFIVIPLLDFVIDRTQGAPLSKLFSPISGFNDIIHKDNDELFKFVSRLG